MEKKKVSRITLTLLLVGTLTSALNMTAVSSIVLNLVQNPCFEDELAFWHVSMGTAMYLADSLNPRRGMYCAKGIELDEGSLGRLYQDVTGLVSPGEKYRISGWIKTQNVVGYAVIALNYVNDYGVTPADGYVKEIGYVTGTTDWAYYESDAFTLPPMPSDASAIWFLLDFNAGKGTAWWDDVSLVEVSLPVHNVDTGEDFATIQEAIDDLDTLYGHTILVDSGTYYEHVTIDKSISLVGEDKHNTIIDGSGIGNVVHVTADNVNISGFTVQNGGLNWVEAGIFLQSSVGAYITDNILSNSYSGIHLESSLNNTICGNEMTSNLVSGIYLDYNSPSNAIKDNIISDTAETSIAIHDSDDNVILNNTITLNDGEGLYISLSSNTLIRNNTVGLNDGDGIVLSESHNTTVSNNTIISNTFDGIHLHASNNSDIADNTILDNGSNGVQLEGSSSHNTISGNTISNNSWHGIWLQYSSSNNISGNNLKANEAIGSYSVGLYLDHSSNNTVSGNTILGNNIPNNGDGVILAYSDFNNILGNNVANSGFYGISLFVSSGNVISQNNSTNNYGVGIDLGNSSFNTLSRNIIEGHNFDGIKLSWSSSNSISENYINSNVWGIWLRESSDNIFYHNSLNNTHQVYDYSWEEWTDDLPSINIWDDDYPSGGNYWSDYEDRYPEAEELDDSGIWDTPYAIDGDNQDNYPLMEPWTPLPRTIDELKTKVEELGSKGEIDNQGIVRSLIAKLNVAQKMFNKERIDQAKAILEGFITRIQKLSEICITTEAADVLIKSAEYIICHY